MYYHVVLTDHCNLSCTYCRGKPFAPADPGDPGPLIDADLPLELAYEPELLYRFLGKDPDASLIFYGGEPLLRPDLVCEMVEHAPARRFLVQTNGLFLDQLPREVVNRVGTLLVSLDGPRGVTDASRGEGTYDRVMANLGKVIANGYRGEVIARMTVTERTDIVEAVRFLAGNGDLPFSSIHWQLDADLAADSGGRSFASWAERSYNPGIRTLIGDWVGRMEREGTVPRWYPFIDPMEDLLLGREGPLRCGAGHANLTIMTDGSIGPCPCMVGMRDYYLGHIRTSDPGALRLLPDPGSFCTSCSILTFCRGRCLYARVLRPWPEELERVVCGTVENLHRGLTAALPLVRELIGEGTIGREDFAHPRYNGCEIIP
ncbi:MAG TPA: TIGR04084 family radical SAM/SPASM domain-containing protein [Methanomicrobiales archaeon]|nr:TIGR04084 family radical SAM/SPASM domain-containing protein [Methanomicrobiales archaeon]